jgi:hypothetical protein
MDVADDPIVKAGTSGNERLSGSVPEAIVKRRQELGFDYGKFDYVIHDGSAILLDANSTPGASRSSQRVKAYAAHLAEGFLPWLVSFRDDA